MGTITGSGDKKQVLETKRGLGNHKGGLGNTTEPGDHKGDRDLKGGWGLQTGLGATTGYTLQGGIEPQGCPSTREPCEHNGVPGTRGSGDHKGIQGIMMGPGHHDGGLRTTTGPKIVKRTESCNPETTREPNDLGSGTIRVPGKRIGTGDHNKCLGITLGQGNTRGQGN